MLPTPKAPLAVVPDNSRAANRNIIRDSKKFTPQSIGDSPILFGTGTPGADNGIRGWGSALKKLGIGGGDSGGNGENRQVLQRIGRPLFEAARTVV